MISAPRLLVAACALLCLLAVSLPAAFDAARAQGFSPAQRSEIEAIVKDYLIKNPDVFEEILREMEKRQTAAEAEKAVKAITDNSDALFNSPRQVTLGNPKGDVTLVEFFDYNCGFCKRALADILELMKTDPNLKIVLKEFPVLGEPSHEAAEVAVAANMQDKGGKKYLDFHQRLLNGRGTVNRARALAAARESGLDMARLEKDLASPEIKATLDENLRLAGPLGVSGTPSYVVGRELVVGAVGVDTLREKINIARCGKPAC